MNFIGFCGRKFKIFVEIFYLSEAFLRVIEMGGFIPDEVVETVRLRADIIGVISQYVVLKKKGKYHFGPCPFHNEKEPSFAVMPEKQIFHCFGCGVGGDVFRFLMLKENMSFPEAVRKLAEQNGVAVPVGVNSIDREEVKREDRAYEINKKAKDFYRHVLQTHDMANEARQYLAERGFSREVLELFQVGFALPAWNGLLTSLSKHGFKPKELAEVGLAATGEGSGRFYDRFRNRIMFPIWDDRGRVVGFGGRVLDETQPKYLNTSETPYFSKGRVLYGLHLAKLPVREEGFVIVMEGYLDVITACQFGVTNAVASLGTSLTREQVRLLMRHTKDIVVAFDADSAGVAATLRGLALLMELGCRVRVVDIPDGKDPDQFIRRQGVQAWNSLVENAFSLVEYTLKKAIGQKEIRTVAEKVKIAQQVLPSLAGLQSEVEKEEGIKVLAKNLSLSWDTVAGELRRFEDLHRKKWPNPDNIAKRKHNILSREDQPDARDRAERGILRLVLEDPALGKVISEERGEILFHRPFHRKVFNLCLETAGSRVYNPVMIFNHLASDEQELLSGLLMEEIPGGDRPQILRGLVGAIDRIEIKERKEQLLREISSAEKIGDQEQVTQLLRDLRQAISLRTP